MTAKGRPTKLTPEIVAEAGRLIATCLYTDTVAALLGFTRSTFYLWLKRGSKELHRLEKPNAKPRESEAVYAEFSDAIKTGRASGEKADLETILNASERFWQAAAWRLERRFPHKWGSDRRQIDDIQRKLKELTDAKGSAVLPPAREVAG